MFNLGDFSMKKTLVALAALASVSAFAQSSVTLGGAFGAGYQVSPNKQKGFAFTDADLNVGVAEDLGGGLRATLATTLQTTGDNFRSGVLRGNTSLGIASADMGSLSFGHTRSSDLLTQALVAPASLPDGIYDSSGVLARGAIDAVTYTSPVFGGGLRAQVAYIENAANTIAAATGVATGQFLGGFSTDGSGTVNAARKTVVLGLSYANGPLTTAVAYKSSKNDDTLYPALAFASTPGAAKKTNVEAVATYNFGVALVGFGLDSATNSKPTAVAAGNTAAYRTYLAQVAGSKTAFGLGVALPMGATTLGVNYAKRKQDV
jgi:predicted porin